MKTKQRTTPVPWMDIETAIMLIAPVVGFYLYMRLAMP